MSGWPGIRKWVLGMLVPPSAFEGRAQPVSYGGAELGPGDAVGEYVIVKKLGEGGFGTVYEATHPVIGKRAAVKVLHAQYSANAEVTSRFVAEARAVNQIRHRNIVDIFSFGDLPDGRHYYVMELLEGVPLDAYLERAGRLPAEEALPILCIIAKALGAAHEAGIAHRDLKPENVFLEIDAERAVHPKILDFGMAKLLGSGALAVHKTRSGTPIGSPRYMSPEQCRGVLVDHRTDVYAFGCMAHRMLTGRPPFDARTALELMMTQVSVPPQPMSSICPELAREFDEAVLKMLEKQPDDRPQSMAAAYALLARAAERAGHEPSGASLPVSMLLGAMVAEREVIAATVLDLSKPRKARAEVSRPTRAVRRVPLWAALLVAAGVLSGGYLLLRAGGPQNVQPVEPSAEMPTVPLAPSELAPPPVEVARAPDATPAARASSQPVRPEASAAAGTKVAPVKNADAPARPRPDMSLTHTAPPGKSAVSRDLEDPY